MPSRMIFFARMQKTGTLRQHFKILAEASRLSHFREQLHRLCAEEGVPAQATRLMVLAVDEAVSNVIEHATLADDSRQIDVSVEINDQKIVIRIQDKGRPFDPRPARKEPDSRSYPRRGFGLYLIQKIVDKIEYERTVDGQNLLTLTKIVDELTPGCSTTE